MKIHMRDARQEQPQGQVVIRVVDIEQVGRKTLRPHDGGGYGIEVMAQVNDLTGTLVIQQIGEAFGLGSRSTCGVQDQLIEPSLTVLHHFGEGADE
jgi:hypothetical protein